MKKNIAIVLALVAFALIGCEKNTPWEPGDPATTKQFIFFPSASELGVELDPDEGIKSHDFVIERKDTKGALTVKLNVLENTDNAYTVPATVEFKDGEAKATVTAKFNKMEVGGTYRLAVEVDLKSINPYALDLNAAGAPNVPVYTFEATLIKYLVGVWVDQTVGPAFGAGESAWTVKYLMEEENEDGYIQFDIVNPYNSMATAQDEHGIPNGFPYNAEGDFDAGNKYNFTLLLDPESGEVVFNKKTTYLGVDWGYGMMLFYDYAAGEGNYGKFIKKDNVIIFDAQDMSMLMGMGGDLYAINVNFEFFLTVDDYLKVDAAAAPARIINKTVFGAQRVR